MSINSNMKLYDLFEISEKENTLHEKSKSLKKIGSCLLSVHEKNINFIDKNNIYRREVTFVSITNDTSLKEKMIININDNFFEIKHIKPSKRFFSLQLKEVDYDNRNY